MRRIYNVKKTISMKQFIEEFDEQLSDNMKTRLLELGKRCILTRKEDRFRLDLKHIEHTQYECAVTAEDERISKEYSYGQIIVDDENLYFSERCAESDTVMQSPIVSLVYEALSGDSIIFEDDKKAKKIDDCNIDFIVDSILSVCPPVSKAHLELVHGMIERSQK